MANISEQLYAIKTGSSGADIRIPLADALNIINSLGRDAKTLNYKTSDFYAKYEDMAKLLPVDTYPRKSSTHLVTGGGIYSMIGDMDNFDWGEDEWQI